MDKNRVILSLLVEDGFFVNSRQFELNRMCNVDTILTYLNFQNIDELVVLDVSRGTKDSALFAHVLETLTRRCFIPVVAGGGIRSIDDCHRLLRAGADKLAINSIAIESLAFVDQASRTFGAQCIVASVDVKRSGSGYNVYSHDGTRNTGMDVGFWAQTLEAHQVGEILLRSIDQDGRACGYDLELIRQVSECVSLPVIATGGVGDFSHMRDGIRAGAQAVAVGNMFHFLGESLGKARDYLHSEGVNVAKSKWNFSIQEHVQ